MWRRCYLRLCHCVPMYLENVSHLVSLLCSHRLRFADTVSENSLAQKMTLCYICAWLCGLHGSVRKRATKRGTIGAWADTYPPGWTTVLGCILPLQVVVVFHPHHPRSENLLCYAMPKVTFASELATPPVDRKRKVCFRVVSRNRVSLFG